MLRRNFLSICAAVMIAVPHVSLANSIPKENIVEGFSTYSPEALEKALKDGETVFLDFNASWCTTCAAQERVIAALRAESPKYDEALTFMLVDWDTWKDKPIVSEMNIPRRSTLVVLRGEEELGRVVAETSVEKIQALMELGL